jgi:hypothetical protein
LNLQPVLLYLLLASFAVLMDKKLRWRWPMGGAQPSQGVEEVDPVDMATGAVVMKIVALAETVVVGEVEVTAATAKKAAEVEEDMEETGTGDTGMYSQVVQLRWENKLGVTRV